MTSAKWSKAARRAALVAVAFGLAVTTPAGAAPARPEAAAATCQGPPHTPGRPFYSTWDVDERAGSPWFAWHPSGVLGIVVEGDTYWRPCQWVQIGKTRLVMQDDGNFVVYDEALRPRWDTGTHVNGGEFATFQPDGNLVVYTYDPFGWEAAVWASHTCCVADHDLVVQEDGNVVIYAPGWRPIWATGTNH